MRFAIAAVGRYRAGPAVDLFRAYAKRIPGGIALFEVEDRKAGGGAAERMSREAALLRQAAPRGAALVALDESGKSMDSEAFAATIGRYRDQGTGELCFLIGGADGLDPSLKGEARLVLALGQMTWPHLLVRALLAEQLYRAHAILTGHPYHRA